MNQKKIMPGPRGGELTNLGGNNGISGNNFKRISTSGPHFETL